MYISYVPILGDLLHYGHYKIIRQAKQKSKVLICGVLSDKVSNSIWGRPISNFNERKSIISSITYVDKVITQDSTSPEKNLIYLKKQFPRYKIRYFHGNLSKEFLNYDILKKLNIEIIKIDHYKKLSRENIQNYFINSLKNNYEFNSKNNLLSDKGTTLLNFKKLLKKSIIPDLQIVNIQEFIKNRNKVADEITHFFKKGKIVVRSSFSTEDNFESSSAGKYLSVLNINVKDKDLIKKSILNVIKSSDKKINKNKEHIIVQRQTTDSVISGVIFTKDINTNSHYYLINYTMGSNTTLVTSGQNSKLIKIRKGLDIKKINKPWKKLIIAVKEIEEKLTSSPLDIEFSINSKNQVKVFQIRPIVFNLNNYQIPHEKFNKLINKNINKYNELKKIKRLTLFSDMAFWNPSELIGEYPRALSKSLFENLITDINWSKSLQRIGYSKVNEKLGYKFGNKFYINLDNSFKGLLLNNIEEKIKKFLVESYKKKLIKNNSAHDKIEFEVVNSCWNFSLYNDLESNLKNNFNKNIIDKTYKKIKIHSLKIINNISNEKSNFLRIEKAFIKKYEVKIKKFYKEKSFISKIKILDQLLSGTKSEISSVFCVSARYGFISLSIIKSAMYENIISSDEYNILTSNIETIASQFQRDVHLFKSNKISKKIFLKKYSHMRPNMFDIESRNFDIDLLSKNFVLNERYTEKNSNLKIKIFKKMFLNENIDPIKFQKFYEISIQLREKYKFVLSKYINKLLLMIENIFEKKFTNKEIANIDLNYLLHFKNNNLNYNDFTDLIKNQINLAYQKYNENENIHLPSVIKNNIDFNIIKSNDTKPNFITNKKVIKKFKYLKQYKNVNLDDKIILIDSADPGFDWIFTFKIKGLITKFGGAASHMAIRCAEFQIPAAIGCGEIIFNDLLKQKRILLDCNKNYIK